MRISYYKRRELYSNGLELSQIGLTHQDLFFLGIDFDIVLVKCVITSEKKS